MERSELVALERAGRITPIPADELARERKEVALRLAAPLMQGRAARYRRQHDASDLALFRHANEPGLL
jgi:hypothetical protein